MEQEIITGDWLWDQFVKEIIKNSPDLQAAISFTQEYWLIIIIGFIATVWIIHWIVKKVIFIWHYRFLYPEKGKQLDALKGKK